MPISLRPRAHTLATRLIAALLPLFSSSLALAQNAPAKLAHHLHTIDQSLDGKLALETVAVLQKYWRHAGNQDFNACMDYLASLLRAGGYDENDALFRLQIKDTLLADEKSWQPFEAELRLVAPFDTLLHAMANTKMTLCINSHSTSPHGALGEIVFVDDLPQIESGSLRGKIAYTHAPPQRYFDKAVVQGGARGLVSSHLPEYNRAAEHPASLSMSSIPSRESPQAFGFKLSYGSQVLLDSLLKRGPVRAQAKVAAHFTPKLVREVIAEIVGTQKPEEGIVLIAHVDEPGANDNASGAAALLEMALAMREAVARGAIAEPARTVRMMWVEEIAALRRWQSFAPEQFQNVQAALVLDMVGEDVAKTGGSFLIEKFPDPSAIWTRPPEAHTEWGGGKFAAENLRGTYLNDLLLTTCATRAQQKPWQVKTNPYEGGSDHVPFVNAGIPAVLAWHFTDVYYHTSGDEIDKVSPQEMANVGTSLAATALFLADCDARDAFEVLQLLEQRAARRMENEKQNSFKILRAANGSQDAIREEERILRAWEKWYEEAFASVNALAVDSSTAALQNAIARARQNLKKTTAESLKQIKQ